MRHRKSGRKLGRSPSHRHMMLRNMVTSLLGHEKIETTLAKAKEVRRLADKVIILAKKGDLHARRQALAILTDKGVVKKLFSEIGPRFQERTSGFTRIFKTGNRVGDAAPLSVVMLAEEKAKVAKEKKGTARARSKAGKTTRAKTEKKKEKKPPEKEAKEVKKTESQQEPSKENTPPKKKDTRTAQTKRKSKEKTSDSSQ